MKKIQNIWEFGYIKNERGVEPEVAVYGIEILWDNGDRDSIKRVEVNEVKIKALEFILEMYTETTKKI